MNINAENPIVFIHYSWDNEAHKEWALKLANRLVADGINIIFDRFDLQIGSNKTYFMERISEADKVIIIMTPEYLEKAISRKGGIGYEYQIIINEISLSINNNKKFLPVLKQGDQSSSVPTFLQAFIYLDMRSDDDFEESYLNLLRRIYEEPELIKPVIGKKPNFHTQVKKENKSKTSKNIFDLGMSKRMVHSILGKPDEVSTLYEAYWSHGIVVYFNRHTKRSDGILAKRLPSGIGYENSILEIKLGDSFAEVKAKLGNPINWGLPDIYSSFAFYALKDKYLTVALWRADPNDITAHYKPGTVYAIAYSEVGCVLACEAIVAISIEEMRQGKIPSHIESKKNSILIDLNDRLIHEPYQILPYEIGMMGGYFVTVVFIESNRAVLFWLYDIGWYELKIRLIDYYGEESKILQGK